MVGWTEHGSSAFRPGDRLLLMERVTLRPLLPHPQLIAPAAEFERPSPVAGGPSAQPLPIVLCRRLRARGKLVSVRIAKIRDEGPIRALTRCALDRHSTVRRAGLMPRENVVPGWRGDSDRPTIGRSSRIAVDGLRDHQPPAVVGVDQPASGIYLAGLAS